MPIHPYFDNIDNIPWLNAQYEKSDPIAFKFFVDVPNVINAFGATEVCKGKKLASKIETTFHAHKLGEFYAVKAAEEISNLDGYFCHPKSNQPQNEIECRFQNEVERFGTNYWKAVLYKTLLYDTWYLDNLLRKSTR